MTGTVAYVLLNGKVKAVEQQLASLPRGINFKGAVDYVNSLPTNAELGDTYTVKYHGTSGTVPYGAEFAWGEYDGTQQWIQLSSGEVGGGKIEMLYNGTNITVDGTVVNFKQIVDYLTVDNKFTYLLYNNMAYLTTKIDTTSSLKQVVFESSHVDGGMGKIFTITVNSSDGVTIASINHTNVANENYSNKVGSIAENDKKSTVHYPSNKAVTDITDGLKEDLSEFEDNISYFENSLNLTDNIKNSIGMLTNTGTVNTNSTEYRTTDFIKVEVGETYSLGVYNTSNYLVQTRTGYAFFNASKQIISDTFVNTDNTRGLLVTVPSNVVYIRMFGHTWDTYKLMVAKSSFIHEEYSEYEKIYHNKMIIDGLDDLKFNVENNTDMIDKMCDVQQGINLVDVQTQTVGFVKNNAGEINPLDGYMTTDFIKVDAGDTYSIASSINGTVVTTSGTRHGYLFYNSDKSPITESYTNIDGVASLQAVAPPNAYFIRAFAHHQYVLVLKGTDIPTNYPEYKVEYVNKMAIPQLVDMESRLEDVESKLSTGITETLHSSNLCDMSIPATQGVLTSPNTWNSTGSFAYYWTKIVTVAESGYYTWYCFKSNNLGTAHNQRHITTIIHNDGTYTFENEPSIVSKTVNLLAGDTIYMGATVNTTDLTDKPLIMLVKGESVITPYEEYFERQVIKDLALEYSFVDNLLKGKKWAVCGDSFTNGSHSALLESGKYKNQRKVYPYFIGNRTGIEVVKFFESGKTLAYPADGTFTNSLTYPSSTYYYQNIPEDIDYITIYLGINDSNHRTGSGTTPDGEDATGVIPIGTVNDTDTSTYGGAWNVVLSWLIENRPFAHIGVIITNGTASSDYVALQKSICAKYGVPYIDLNGDERTPAMIRSQNPNIATSVKNIIREKQAVDADGTKYGSIDLHPNDDAHEYESYFIENFLKSI